MPDKPLFDRSMFDRPMFDEPMSDKSVSDEHVPDEHVSNEPVPDEPVSDESVSNELASDEHVSDELAILYVEDNFDNRTLVSRVLMVEGYKLIEAASATEALELLNTTIPDLILMDINMPDMDGYTLTKKIKQTPGLESVPILALTANVMRGDRERSLEAGCDGYIEKPVDIDLLPRQIERFLRK